MATQATQHATHELFLSYLAAKKQLVDTWIATHHLHPLEHDATNADLTSFLYDPLEHFHAGAGKRVRPVLALLGCEACGGEASRALAAGCAVEIFQSAALIHDDIADQGQLRRGEPCLHLSAGVGPAINVGDTALVQAFAALSRDDALEPALRLQLIDEFIQMEQYTLEGQALDLCWVRDKRWDLSSADYVAMATRKTAHYSAATPLVLGALCAEASQQQLEALRNFGLAAGLAFQVTDDLLNLIGDAQSQGKDFRSDICEGKRTYAVCWALEHLAGATRTQLVELLSAHNTQEVELTRAVELLQSCGAIAAAQDFAQRSIDEALTHLISVELDDEAAQTLMSMAHFFIERDA